MTKQDKDPDGSGSVKLDIHVPSPQTTSQRPSGNTNPLNPTEEAPNAAATHKSSGQVSAGTAGKHDNTNPTEERPTSTHHLPNMAFHFDQEFVRNFGPGFAEQMTEATNLMIERVSEMVENADLDSFLLYKEELLAVEQATGPNSNYFFLKQGLGRLESNIRSGNTLTNLDCKINPGSQVPGNSAISGSVGAGPNVPELVPEVENVATVGAEPSKKKRKKKKDSTKGGASTDELPSTMKTNVDNSLEGNGADLELATCPKSSLAKLQTSANSTVQPTPGHMGNVVTIGEDLDKKDATGDAEAPRKKGRKRRGKKKTEHGMDERKRLPEINTPAATGSSPSHHLSTTDETGAEHTCGNKHHGRCSHTTWKNGDSTFSKVLADTLRELLLTTPLDPKLKLELHVDMNKIKRRVDEIEAADGDASILRTKKQLSSASNKPPFSAFGKVITPELQRATSIHLLSTPKYYNGFLDYIEHLNYLVSCGDEKAAAMADEAELVYSVVTAVYKEVSDNTRSKVDAAAVKREELSLTEGEIHEKRLAESAEKMKRLQELEQGIRQPDDATPVTKTSNQSTANPVPVQIIRDHLPSSTELETKVLSLLKQPAVLRRFISDYQKMRPNSGAYGSFWGQESHLLYQRLVDMRVAPNLGKQPPSQGSHKKPSSPDGAIETLVRDEVGKIYDYLLKEQKARGPEAPGEAEDEDEDEAKLPAVSNPSKTRDFVDRVMRAMVKQFAISPTGIRRFIWPLKFISEHPSIHEKLRAAAVCLLTDMSQLSEYEPFLQRAKNTPWYKPRFSTLIKLSAQEHVKLFMDAVSFMKSALESAPPRGLRHNANRNQSILPSTKRAGLPIKAQISYHIRDYESAYTAALNDEGRASVNRDFCLPFLDCPRYFRETANELHANAVEYAAFIEQKNNLANLPACFGDAGVRHSLVSSALLLVSAVAELDPSPQSDRLLVMEVVAASSSYLIPLPAQGPLAACRDAFSSYLAANEKVKATFVREDVHYQAAAGLSGNDEKAGPQEIGDRSKEHVPYVLGKWMADAMTDDEAVAERIPSKPSTAKATPTNPLVSEVTIEPSKLDHSQKMLKKRLVAANYKEAQKFPQSQYDIRAKARLVLSDSNMLSSFFKSKEAMEYCSGDDDTPDEKFVLSEIKRIYAEMKKMNAEIDAGVGPHEPVGPTSRSMPPPTTQLSSPREDHKKHEMALPKMSSTPAPTQNAIELSMHPDLQCVTVHHSETRQSLIRPTPAPTPIIHRGLGVAYSSLVLPTRLTATLRPNAPPLPSDPELAKECIISETARQRRKSLATIYANSLLDYEYFQVFKDEADETIQGVDPMTEEGYRARKVLRALDDVDAMVQTIRYGVRRDTGKGSTCSVSGHIYEAAADLLSDFDKRPRLMLILNALEQLFGGESSSRQDPDAEPLVGLRLSQRFEKLVVSAHYGLFDPENGEVVGEMQEPTAKQPPRIPCPMSVIDNRTRPLTDKTLKRMPILTDSGVVIGLAMDYHPGLSDILSSAIRQSSGGKDDTAKLSELKIQKVLGGLDAMPVPPQVVADLYKSGPPAPKVPRFTDGDEAVAYMQSQMEGAKASLSVSVSRSNVGSSVVADNYGVSVPTEYTVVPDFTQEGEALGKAMEDIQISASKGEVPTDYQMAALGKARRELYASRVAKTSATTDSLNETASKPHSCGLSVSTRAENRAAANLLARSEAMPLVGIQHFPNPQSAATSLEPRQTSFSPNGFPLPHPAPQSLQSPSTPSSNQPDALRIPLRTVMTETPISAAMTTLIGVQREVDNLFISIDDSNEFQECRASLGLPDPTTEESEALLSLNKVFATYKAVRVVEERRLEELVDSAQEYRSNVNRAIAEVRRRNQGLDSALENLDDYKLYNKRIRNALERELSALNGIPDDNPHKRKRRSRKSDRRGRGLGKKLGALRKTTIEDFEAPEEYHGDGPKLGTFRVG
ncbi:hypothetical protein V498_00594 [Pseudogymnoascus sp. VKM F-4517 (FW-2822)]|nr:hypothetical protein V498_00594 [Pseudogymnoascus sp. VKM F-4517 (FW-2822)]